MMEEYLSDVDGHDQKMLQERVMDLAEDATFVYSTLQAARYHRSMWGPQEWPSPVHWCCLPLG